MTQESGIGPIQGIGGAPNLWWQITDWWIDQSNLTGKASDLAPGGGSATNPLLTWKGGVIAKFGTSSPILNQNTTFHFMSSTPSGAGIPEDPVFLTPTMKSQTRCSVLGTADAHNLLGSGVIANHTAKNRAKGTGQLEQIDIGAIAGAVPGTMVVNTDNPSRAFLYKNVGGTVWAITQPTTINDTWPLNPADPQPVNTWANGQHFSLYNLDLVDIINFRPVVAEFDNSSAAEFTLFNQIGIQNPPGTLVGPCYLGDTCAIMYCFSQRRVVLPVSAYARNSIMWNCALDAGLSGGPLQTPWDMANGPWVFAGYAGSLQLIGGVVDQDLILKSANSRMLSGVISAVCVDAPATLYVANDVLIEDWGEGGGGPFVWGQGTADVKGNLVILAPTTAAASLLVSTLLMNGAGTAFTATVASPSVVTGGVAISPANVDAHSTLWTPGGGSIRLTG